MRGLPSGGCDQALIFLVLGRGAGAGRGASFIGCPPFQPGGTPNSFSIRSSRVLAVQRQLACRCRRPGGAPSTPPRRCSASRLQQRRERGDRALLIQKKELELLVQHLSEARQAQALCSTCASRGATSASDSRARRTRPPPFSHRPAHAAPPPPRPPSANLRSRTSRKSASAALAGEIAISPCCSSSSRAAENQVDRRLQRAATRRSSGRRLRSLLSRISPQLSSVVVIKTDDNSFHDGRNGLSALTGLRCSANPLRKRLECGHEGVSVGEDLGSAAGAGACRASLPPSDR